MITYIYRPQSLQNATNATKDKQKYYINLLLQENKGSVDAGEEKGALSWTKNVKLQPLLTLKLIMGKVRHRAWCYENSYKDRVIWNGST